MGSYEERQERIACAKRMLLAALAKKSRVRISAFISAMQEERFLGVREETAHSYWEAIRKSPEIRHDGFEIWLASGD